MLMGIFFWPCCPFAGHTYLMPSPTETKYDFVPPPPLHFLNVVLIISLIFSSSPADLLYSLKFTPFHLPLHILKTYSHSISSSSLPLDPAPSLSHVPCPVLSMYLTVISLSCLPSTLNMKTLHSSGAFSDFYRTTQRHVCEDFVTAVKT